MSAVMTPWVYALKTIPGITVSVFVDDRIGSDRDGGRLHVVGAGGRVVGSGVGRAHAHDVEERSRPVDRVVRDVQPSRE